MHAGLIERENNFFIHKEKNLKRQSQIYVSNSKNRVIRIFIKLITLQLKKITNYNQMEKQAIKKN